MGENASQRGPAGFTPADETQVDRGVEVHQVRAGTRSQAPVGAATQAEPARGELSLTVTGRSWLIGAFFTEAMKSLPGAAIYDRSDQANEARGKEAALGLSGLTDEAGRETAQRVAEDLAKPLRTTFTADFSDEETDGRKSTTVVILGPRGRRSLTFTFLPQSTLEDVTGFLSEILETMRSLQ